MRSSRLRTLFFISCSSLPLGACTADVHDNQVNVDIPNLSISTNVDVSNVHQGQSVPVTINAENVTVAAPNSTPPAGHADDAVFFKLFLDDENSTELVVAASLKVDVTIPPATPPGPHKLICKAFRHDGAPTDAETSIDITVTASVTTSTTMRDQ